MRAIIADDEKLARSTLRSMLNELDSGLEIVGEAKDGGELAEMMDANGVDIVFVDIKMPVMSGLEVVQRFKESSPNTQFLILSGYSEFEYAREALRLNALDYLLKPVDLDELALSLKKARERYIFQIRAGNSEFANILASLVYMTRSIEDIPEYSVYKDWVFSLGCFTFSGTLTESQKKLEECRYQQEIREHADLRFLCPEYRTSMLILPNGYFVQVIGMDPRLAEKGKKMLEDYWNHTVQDRIANNNSSFKVSLNTFSDMSFQSATKKLLDLAETNGDVDSDFGDKKDEDESIHIVDKVVAFVENNYMKDIGIGQIAYDLEVTPNYLSSLFHRRQGVTFMKFLTKIRMERAKEILEHNPHIKIYEVAEQVGYYTTRHFTKLFREYFNCYPSELRDGQFTESVSEQ
ncbi:response regulator transcription factor [Paenibacillus ihumii]|uniref:response regulator transcription factor n=1 Tax=Paenibacillus ihumii TaxID=687436 RepID=UPI0006D83F97|nr:response regulator [Paenibacillus ihumii]